MEELKSTNSSSFGNSVSLRLLIIGLLVLLLLIPGGMIGRLVAERREYSREAVAEITAKWAEDQTIAGPVLTVPFVRRWVNDEGKTQSATDYMQLLPENLNYQGEIKPHIRYRGIYRAVLYQAGLKCTGTFAPASLALLNVPPADIKWREAFITIGLPDMRGINEYIVLHWGDDEYRFEPGIKEGNDLFSAGVSVNVPVSITDTARDFSFALDLNGSGALNFLPLGRTTMIRLQSSWADPSFGGAFLPKEREVTDQGFTASWKILDLNRNYPQQWTGAGRQSELGQSAFGVTLFTPVDQYTQADRATKYEILFVGLTFLIFFAVEVLNKRRIHPIQYLLVGLALCLFYVLLLSLSEHIGFVPAYLAAAAGVVALITLYVGGALRDRRAVWTTACALSGLYGFLYVLLHNQDYALLIGSLGLFAVMAAVMYLSRNINWYTLESNNRKER